MESNVFLFYIKLNKNFMFDSLFSLQIWDLGMFLTMKHVYMTGYTMLALTVGSAVGLAAFY